MLRTRLWMGALLIALVVGALVVDQWLAPGYPFLLLVVLGLSLAACYELLQLLETTRRLPCALCYVAVATLVLANWPAHVWDWAREIDPDPWHWVLGTFTAVVLTAFLYEMATFREPGESVNRVAAAVWVAGYLGLLPSFITQLRWLGSPAGEGQADPGTVALALAIFVPKMGDTGAYFTGRLLGRHRMTPVLSPKKTWEGAAGAVVAAVLTAVGINRLGPALRGGLLAEVGFGVSVGVAGMLGDLAESLIKRDCKQKDASHAVPGFGGVLDVVDSVIFAAPVAYCWLRRA
jgi:phosphatidate cytidylyltransferase